MRDLMFHGPWRPSVNEPEATETENPVTHRLLGPNGETIRLWRERPVVEFGFQPTRPTNGETR